MRFSPLLLLSTLLLSAPAARALQANPGPTVVQSRRVADRGETQSQPTTGAPPTFRILPVPTGPSQEPRNDADDADGAAIYRPPNSPIDLDFVVSNGELRLERTLLRVEGRGEVHFVLELTYRSRLDYEGPLGFGWTFTYDEALSREPNGDLLRHDGRGHVDRWIDQGNGTYQASVGFFGTIHDQPGGRFVLRETNGYKRYYQGDGRLERVEDRNANTMVFSYTPAGELSSVQDVFGRSYAFTYADVNGGDRRLTRVGDFSGREVVFTYDPQGDLVGIRSPIVVGTSTGNDFPQGRTEAYTYLTGQADPELDHNLATLTRPNEVAVGGPPALVVNYGTSGLERDRVVSAALGGTNATGTPAGGSMVFTYTPQNPGLPPGNFDQPRQTVEVTDRSGNVQELDVNERDHVIRSRRLTRGLRAGEPPHFERVFEYTRDGQRTRGILPLGNEELRVYDSGSRAAEKNLVRVELIPDLPRGGGESRVTTYAYDPVFNLRVSATDPRGNSTTWTPPIGVVTAARYTTTQILDYQEGSGPVPEAVAFSIPVVGIPRGLGDQNGDGRTDQTAGNVVRVIEPEVTLEPGSNLAVRTGSTVQPAITETVHGEFGVVLRVIDPAGNPTDYDHFPENDPDGDGLLVPGNASVLPLGYLSSIVKDGTPSPRRQATYPPRYQETRFQRNPLGRVTSRKNPRGVATTYEVTALDETVRVVKGADVSQAASSGQLITGESADAYVLVRRYDHNGNETRDETELRDSPAQGLPAWIPRDRRYDILDGLVELTGTVGTATTVTTRFEHDPDGYRTAVVRPLGNRVEVVYDERSLPFQVRDGAGSPVEGVYTYDYDGNGNLIRKVDADDTDGDGSPEVTEQFYDGWDQQDRWVDPMDTEWHTVYDPVGNPEQLSVLGHSAGAPGGPAVLLARMHVLWDERSRPFGRERELFLRPNQFTFRPIVLTDGDGDGWVEERVERDAMHRVVFTVEDDGETVELVLDGLGWPVERRDGLGNREFRDFDQNGNRVHVRELLFPSNGGAPQARDTWRVFDQHDQEVRAVDARGAAQRADYDSRGLQTLAEDAVGNTFGADPFGQVGLPINLDGNRTVFHHDGLARLTARITDSTANAYNPDGLRSESFGWDDNSNPVATVDDDGNVRLRVFDDRDQVVAEQLPTGAGTTLTRNLDGELVEILDPNGSRIVNRLDANARLVQQTVTPAAGVSFSNIDFGYDGIGALTFEVYSGPTGFFDVLNAVDSLGRHAEEVYYGGQAVTFRRTGAGDVVRTTYPSGRSVVTGYNPLSQPITVSDGAGTIVQDIVYLGPRGELLELAYPNNVREQHGLDAAGYPVSLAAGAGGGNFLQRIYGVDGRGRLEQETRVDDGGGQDLRVFGPDGLLVENLLDQNGPAHRDPFQFLVHGDGRGNRRLVDVTGTGGTTQVPWSVNSLNGFVQIGGTPLQLDAAGRTVDDGAFQYTYDAYGQPVEIRNGAGQLLATYGWLPGGRLAQRLDFDPNSGSLTAVQGCVWGGDDLLEVHNLLQGNVRFSYVHVPGLDRAPVQVDVIDPALPPPFDRYRSIVGAEGNVDALVYGKAQAEVLTGTWVAQKFAYDAWGNVQVIAGANPTPPSFGWHGELRDDVTGAYITPEGWYDPRRGRLNGPGTLGVADVALLDSGCYPCDRATRTQRRWGDYGSFDASNDAPLGTLWAPGGGGSEESGLPGALGGLGLTLAGPGLDGLGSGLQRQVTDAIIDRHVLNQATGSTQWFDDAGKASLERTRAVGGAFKAVGKRLWVVSAYFAVDKIANAEDAGQTTEGALELSGSLPIPSPHYIAWSVGVSTGSAINAVDTGSATAEGGSTVHDWLTEAFSVCEEEGYGSVFMEGVSMWGDLFGF